ncbi:MucBP domain-containing protein, partial [Latilactobacillus fuchuensis]
MKKFIKGVSVLAALATINPATIASAATTNQTQPDVTQSTNETATSTKPTSQEHHLSNLFAENPKFGYMLAQGCVGQLNLYVYSGEQTQYLTNTYIVMPKGYTIEGGLTAMQASLDQYRKMVKIHNNGTDDGTLSVKQLANTADGREVYEVVPGEGSYVVQNENKEQIPMVIPIRSAIDTPGLILNAFGPNDMGDNILFAGAGDGTNVAYDASGNYSQITAASVGITGTADTYVRGVWGPQRNLAAISASIKDTYNLVDADTKQIIGTRVRAGDIGDTYSRVGFCDTLGIFGVDVAAYDEKTLTIDRGTLADTNLTLNPSDPTAGFTDNPYIMLEGQTYTMTVKRFGKSVTVEYLDQDGKRIKDAKGVDTTEVLKGDVGDNYTASYKDIPGYISSDKDNHTGQFTDTAQTITYQYAKAGQNVTVNYVDADGKQLAPSETLTGKVGDLVNAVAAKIDGYAVTKTNAKADDKFTDKAQTITYVYGKKGEDVTVNYVDADGNQLADSKTLTGIIGDKVNATAAKIDGYAVTKTNAKADDEFTNKAQTITYQYAKIGQDVTVNYVDATGKKMADSVTLKGNIGDLVNAKEADLDGYVVTKTNATGNDQFTDKAQTITYQYAKIAKSVTINYTDIMGNQLVDSTVLKGNVDDQIDADPLDIDGYRILNPDATKGHKFTNDYQAISYRYARIGLDVTVNYVDAAGNKLADSVTLKGDFGDLINAKEAAVEGYTVVRTNAKEGAIFTDYSQTVTYVYAKIGQDVTVNYVDAAGDKLADSRTLSGNVGDPVNTEAVKIDGYVMIKTNATTNDQFSDNAQTITYQYAKIGQDVTVKYVDATGKKLADSVTLKGNVGDPVNTKEVKIDGYVMTKTNATANDQFTDEAQTITYQYTKIAKAVTVKYEDADGNKLADSETITGNVGDSYTVAQKDIKGYTFKMVTGQETGTLGETAQTVTYVYTKNPAKVGNVTVNYQDADGKQIAASKTLTGNVGTAYQAVQASIDGYTFKQVKGNTTGQFSDKTQTVTYVYTKNPAKVGNVTVNYQDAEGKQIAASKT